MNLSGSCNVHLIKETVMRVQNDMLVSQASQLRCLHALLLSATCPHSPFPAFLSPGWPSICKQHRDWRLCDNPGQRIPPYKQSSFSLSIYFLVACRRSEDEVSWLYFCFADVSARLAVSSQVYCSRGDCKEHITFECVSHPFFFFLLSCVCKTTLACRKEAKPGKYETLE